MKTIVERYKEQRDLSTKFKEENFGLMVGDGFPELVREMLQDERIAVAMMLEHVQIVWSDPERIKANLIAGDMCGAAAKLVYSRIALRYLYWGMEIGRQLEREQREVQSAGAL